MRKTRRRYYDALHVFGAVMRWDGESKKWTFPLILEENEYSGRLVLGDWRAKAAVVLSNAAPVILVTGGSNKHPETGERCSRAIELARLIVELGVPADKVIPIGTDEASHTLGNIENMARYFQEHPEIKSVGMVCPRFQMQRAMMMQYSHPFFAGGQLDLDWIEVEAVLVEIGILLESAVNVIYSSPEAAICWAMEQQGTKDFLLKNYQTRKSA